MPRAQGCAGAAGAQGRGRGLNVNSHRRNMFRCPALHEDGVDRKGESPRDRAGRTTDESFSTTLRQPRYHGHVVREQLLALHTA